MALPIFRKAMTNAEIQKRWKQINPDGARANQRRYRKAHPDRMRAKWRRQYTANASKRAIAAQARRDADREKYNAMVRERRRKNPERNRVAVQLRRERITSGNVTASDVLAQMKTQEGRCFYCTVHLDGTYEMDHYVSLVNGGEHKPENIVLACRNCNRRKNRLNGDQFIEKLRRAA